MSVVGPINVTAARGGISSRERERRPTLWALFKANRHDLRFAGWASLLGYAAIAIISWTGYVYRPHWVTDVLLIPALALPAIFYFRARKLLRLRDKRLVLKFAIAFGIVSFLTVPFDSTDVFFYMAVGWQQSHYQLSPYTHLVREIPEHAADPMFNTRWMSRNYNPWLDIPLPYGFLFARLAGAIAWLGFGNWWITLLLFNVMNLAAHAGVALLLWKLSKLLPNGNPVKILFLYTWNPLVLTQSLANVHNDILMGYFILLAVYFLASERPALVLPSLVAGGLIKYLAFGLVPFAAIAIWRMFSFRKVLAGIALSAVVFGVVGVPYLLDKVPFKMVMIAAQITESSGSLHHFLDVALLHPLGSLWPQFRSVIPTASLSLYVSLWLLFGVFAAYQLWRSLHDPLSIERIIQQWLVLLAGVLFVASSLLHSWYLGAVLPLAVLGYRTWVSRAIIVSSTGFLLSFTSLHRKMIVFIICVISPFAFFYRKAQHSRRRHRSASIRFARRLHS